MTVHDTIECNDVRRMVKFQNKKFLIDSCKLNFSLLLVRVYKTTRKILQKIEIMRR